MKRSTYIILFVFFLLAIVLTNSLYNTKANPPDEPAISALPAALDNFFPPKAKQPVYLMKMLNMGMAMSGMMADMFENDFENVMKGYEKFKAQYVKVSKMIPEWTDQFPMKPVEDLGIALKSGNQDKIMAAFQNAGMACIKCHLENMVAVQQKYHWQDFSSIMIDDPLTKQKTTWIEFKHMLDANFVGIGLDLEQGQKENAVKQFEGFKARFEALKDACSECHDSPRKYYVDDEVMGMIDELGRMVTGDAGNPQDMGRLFMQIGMESCFKCHLVHVPAAMSKHKMMMPGKDMH